MHSLLIANIPYDCTAKEVSVWLEKRGVPVKNIRLISDLVTGTSPGFAQAQIADPSRLDAVARLLDGQALRDRKLKVKPAVYAA